MTSAKLLVCGGGLVQASGGETFSPPQGGVRLTSKPPYLRGSTSPSLKAEEVRVKGSAAWTAKEGAARSNAIARARRIPRSPLRQRRRHKSGPQSESEARVAGRRPAPARVAPPATG